MSWRRSSPCLKIIPIVSLDRAVGSAHLNSSHSGFFLEAITLHFSICKGRVTCFQHIMNTCCGDTNPLARCHYKQSVRRPSWKMMFDDLGENTERVPTKSGNALQEQVTVPESKGSQTVFQGTMSLWRYPRGSGRCHLHTPPLQGPGLLCAC